MKKIIFIIISLTTLLFSTTAFAGSTGMPTSFKVTYKSINANQIEISWEPIPNVKEYRICVANNCGGPDETKIWITINPNKTSYIYDLPVGKTETFWVHALMEQSATKWTFTDDRPNLLGIKWDNGPGFAVYTNNWIDPNATTTTVPQTTTTTVPQTITTTVPQTITTTPKKTKLPTNTTPTTIDYTQELIDQGIKPLSPTTSTSTSTSTIPQTTLKQEKEQTLMFGLKVAEFIVIMSILALAFIYLLIQQMLNFKMKSKRFELEKVDKEHERQAREYELRELAKAKLNNEHEQTLKKIDHDVVKDRLEYTERQLKDERNFNLEQQKISSHNAEQILNYVMPIVQNRDEHELRMAEIKASVSNKILDADDITEAKVRFKK